MAITSSSFPNANGKMTIAATFDPIAEQFNCALIDRIAFLVAERYVQENYVQIAASLDQQAIANLAVADAGKRLLRKSASAPSS